MSDSVFLVLNVKPERTLDAADSARQNAAEWVVAIHIWWKGIRMFTKYNNNRMETTVVCGDPRQETSES